MKQWMFKREFDKIGGDTTEITFAFDRNTDMGPIQIAHRFHTCVIGKELYLSEGFECEKKLIKNLNKPNPLAARQGIEIEVKHPIIYFILQTQKFITTIK